MEQDDAYWMSMALGEAAKAMKADEVPVGAVLVRDGELVAAGHNQSITTSDPTAHAEIVVLRKAGHVLQNYRLINTTLYVTLEPCCMCLGALVHARVKRVVFAASDLKTGACGGAIPLSTHSLHNHQLVTEGGVMVEASLELIQTFFKQKRDAKRKVNG